MRRRALLAAALAATATSQIDVGCISLTPGLLASVDRGIGIRVVGDKESIRRNVASRTAADSQKFFGSFFQERTPFLD
jgi:hypothetical protein